MNELGFAVRDIGDKVTLLIVPDSFQGGGSVEEWLRQDTDEQETDLINSQGWSEFMKQQAQVDQEEVCQGHQGHVMMPTQPRPGFIVVQPDLAFAFFKEAFNRPAQAAEPHQVGQRQLGGSVGEVKLNVGWVVQVAADDQPQVGARQAVAGFDHAQESKITDDRAFAAFLEGGPCPSGNGQQLEPIFDSHRLVLRPLQLEALRMRPASFPLRHTHFRARLPDQRRGLDVGEIPDALQGRYAIAKGRRIAIQSVGGHPAQRQGVSSKGGLQQFQGDLRLGFVQQIVGHTTGPTQVGVRCLEPGLDDIQFGTDQAVPFPADIAQIHAVLTVGDFADCPTVLRPHAYRRHALFDHTTLIHQHHPSRFTQRLAYQRLMQPDQRVRRPRALTDKILQVSHVLPQGQCHALYRLARLVTQQPYHIHFEPRILLTPPEPRLVLAQILFQFWHTFRHLTLRQIEVGRWRSIAYNYRGHGFFLAFTRYEALKIPCLSLILPDLAL